MRIGLKNFFFCLIFTVNSIIFADVYLLGPGGGVPSSPGQALNPFNLWSEPVIINGIKCELKVSLLRTNLAESFKRLRQYYPTAKFAYNAESLLFEVKDGKLRRRVYLVETGKAPYPVVLFSIEYKEIPANLKWPSSLPSAPDITPIQVMEFPERGSVYGRFSSTFPAKNILSSLDSALEADGWQPLTREAKKAELGTAKGEFYIKFNPTQIITISTLNKDNGGSEAIIYRKKIKDLSN